MPTGKLLIQLALTSFSDHNQDKVANGEKLNRNGRSLRHCEFSRDSVSGAKVPGILIQGDSLKSMAELADEIGERLRLGDFEEAKAIAEELSGQLGSRVKLYEEALNANSLATPYPKTR